MKALIVIDPQNDFCPGGALAVAGGDEIMPQINAMMDDFDMVVLTQDWHPAGHSSFASSHDGADPFTLTEMPYGPQVLWPDHCIQASAGADFHPSLNTDRADAIIRKGMNPAGDSDSAFFATGLAGLLNGRGCNDLTMVGLATDYCVAWSALDGAAQGFKVEVVLPACRAIDLDGSLDAALANMRAAGISLAG